VGAWDHKPLGARDGKVGLRGRLRAFSSTRLALSSERMTADEILTNVDRRLAQLATERGHLEAARAELTVGGPVVRPAATVPASARPGRRAPTTRNGNTARSLGCCPQGQSSDAWARPFSAGHLRRQGYDPREIANSVGLRN
jgi:hypothetical protein